MLLYFIAFVRPQPIAVRRGERPERGRPTLIDHTASVRRDRRCMTGDGRAECAARMSGVCLCAATRHPRSAPATPAHADGLSDDAAFNVCAHILTKGYSLRCNVKLV